MITNSSVWNEQKRGWRSLKGLHPTAIHLERISLIREKSPEYLARAANLETLLLDLGLNDEGIDEFPASLHPFCGSGLRIAIMVLSSTSSGSAYCHLEVGT